MSWMGELVPPAADVDPEAIGKLGSTGASDMGGSIMVWPDEVIVYCCPEASLT